MKWESVSEWTLGGYLMARSAGNYSHNFDYKGAGQIHFAIQIFQISMYATYLDNFDNEEE